MKTHGEKDGRQETAREPAGNAPAQAGPAAQAPRQLAQGERIAQLRRPEAGRGGLPAALRSGIEALSGMDLSDVRVHRTSSRPATLQAHAYAQGADIHLAPGQERHLPHEAWHVVQQRQGRVRPTSRLGGVPINDNRALEREADVMGTRALGAVDPGGTRQLRASGPRVAQLATDIRYDTQQAFGHGAFAMGAYAVNTPVGTQVTARLDRADPKQGSATGVGALAGAMAALGGGWVQGHLLNANAGGLAVDSNLVPITAEANGYHERLVEAGVKVNLHNANVPLRLADPNDPGYDVWYRVMAMPVNLGGNPYGVNNPDVDLVTSWRYWRAGQDIWSSYRHDRIKSRAGPAAYAPDLNWLSAGTRLGGGFAVVANRRVVPVGHPAMLAWGGPVPMNMTHAIIDAVLGMGGAIVGVNSIQSWHNGVPTA